MQDSPTSPVTPSPFSPSKFRLLVLLKTARADVFTTFSSPDEIESGMTLWTGKGGDAGTMT